MRIITNGMERDLVHSKPHTSRAKSIKPPKITKGSKCPRKPNHVQKGLLNVDMLPNEMPEYHMAHSIEANNGGMDDINTSACHCGHCQWLSKVGFNDQAPLKGLLVESTMIHDHIDLSHYDTSSH
jgi:hypothetical protein